MSTGGSFSAASEWIRRLRALPEPTLFFGIWAALVLLSLGVAVAGNWYFLAGFPIVLLLIFWTVVDYRKVFLLLMACIPLSTEVVLPNGFGTDVPTEPLNLGLMLVAIALFFYRGQSLDGRVFRHPLTLLLLAHIGWIFLATLQSDLLSVSLKFSLAKAWYVAVYFFLALYLIRGEQDFRQVFWWVFWPLVFTVAIIMARHAQYGFSFADVYRVLSPFQRNHVSYAGMLALFLPWVWMIWRRFPAYSGQWWAMGGVVLWLVVAVYFTYTRAAYVALVLAVIAYWIIRLRLMRHALLLSLILALAGAGFILSGERYLSLSPDFEHTISHKEFDNLLEATAKGEDISTMERLYRWIAGVEMSRHNPVFGFGPGNFVNFYRSYTVTSFQTYVSGNEEKSGIHSYFLMTLAEQGWPGLLLFLLLSLYIFFKGERIYHQTTDPARKQTVMAVLLCLVVIYAFLIINDMIETDKVGSFYFFCLAVLVRMDLLNRPRTGA